MGPVAILEEFNRTGARIVSLPRYAEVTGVDLGRLPRALRTLLECSLRGGPTGALPAEEADVAVLRRPSVGDAQIRFNIRLTDPEI